MVSERVDATITWPTTNPPRRAPATVKVKQYDYRHDMVVLTYYAEPHAVRRYKEGTPVVVQWGVVPGKTETFYGTVLFARPHLENERHAVRVVCIGTSYPFKDSKPSVLHNISIEQIISREIRKAHFGLVRERASVEWPMILRHGDESGWEYYVRLAQRLGYSFFVNKTTAFLIDPVKMLLDNVDSHPVLTYHYGRGNDFGGQIITFTPEIGDQGVPRQMQQERRLLTVDPRSNAIIGAGSDGDRYRSLGDVKDASRFAVYMDQPAHSVKEAVARVRGERAANRWRHRALAVAYGNARVRQGTGVRIRGVNHESDGLWYVAGVEHEVTKESHASQWRYFMELHLVRDSRASNAVVNETARTLRSSVAVHGTATNRRAPRSVWRNGRWVSAHPVETVLT